MSLVGRIYLGMHSVVDIVGGLAFGMVILAFWLTVHPKIDEFVVSGQSGMCFLLVIHYFTYCMTSIQHQHFRIHILLASVTFCTGSTWAEKNIVAKSITSNFRDTLSIPDSLKSLEAPKAVSIKWPIRSPSLSLLLVISSADELCNRGYTFPSF